ncbi:TraR/DksA C4-type zinc finger protein [Deltaproteobacteria bacterium IMCC39524]|nr:TraR/DksA C4-type zinc finger protein [Deltaproteobacteria bacterium IMCC39524]
MNELSEQQKQELNKELLNLRDELQTLLADSSDGAQPVSLDEPIGRLSRMDAMQQQSMVQANRRTAQTRLTRIETALRRCADDDYGLCASCEEEIGYARLKAQPETPFCIDCQSNKETRSR